MSGSNKLKSIFLNSGASLFFLILVLAIFNHREGVATQDRLQFDLDWASYKYDSERSYVEIYYSVPSRQLQIKEGKGREGVVFNVDLKIFQGDSIAFSRSWNSVGRGSHESGTSENERMVTLTRALLAPGTYSISTRVTERGAGRSSERKAELIVASFPDEEFALSDIQLAYSIETDTSEGRYTKNNYKVLPNPGLLYDVGHPILYFYSELYNLNTDTNSSYTVVSEIVDDEGRVVKAFPPKNRTARGRSVVEVAGLNVISLPAGAYYLKLNVTDYGAMVEATKQKKFYVYREGEGRGDRLASNRLTALGQYYARLIESRISEEFDLARYIASSHEKEVFKTLDLEGKRIFLSRFWSNHKPAGTSANEYRRDYLIRVKAANQRFSSPQREGWRTDRGRVLILYGDPDETDRNTSIGDTRGYESWYYRTGGREMLFVFVEKTGWDELELVHSTARGEVYDPDWERWISVR